MTNLENDYRKALERLEQDANYIQHQREHLESIGIVGEQLERAMQPALSFHEQLKEEVDFFEQTGRDEINKLDESEG
jgi:hypothetical protein